MSRYDGLIIPRSYSEYINKTDAATLQQALQLSGVLSGTVAAGDNKAIKSSAVHNAINNLDKVRSTDLGNNADANNCRIDDLNYKGTYFYCGNFNKNVPKNSYAIIRCYQYGGDIRQFIDYTNGNLTETWERFIQYNGANATLWKKLQTIKTIEINGTTDNNGFLVTNIDKSEKVIDFNIISGLSVGYFHRFFKQANGNYSIQIMEWNDKKVANLTISGNVTCLEG